MTLIKVELSLNVRRIVVNAASGPLTKTRTASCGRYANTNMKRTTPRERPMVGTSFERSGFHSSR